jgi:hypothetical protein
VNIWPAAALLSPQEEAELQWGAAEFWAEDEPTRRAIMHGQADVTAVSARAARGGTDLLSLAVAGVAGRLWTRAGRRGFRFSVRLWRFAVLIILRWMAGNSVLRPPSPLPAPVPPIVPAPELVTWRKVRDQLTDRMTVGPPALVAIPEVLVIDP